MTPAPPSPDGASRASPRRRRLGEGAIIVLAGVGGYLLSIVAVSVLMACGADRSATALAYALPAIYALPFAAGLVTALHLDSKRRQRRVERARKRGKPEAAPAPIRPHLGILPAAVASYLVGSFASLMIIDGTNGGIGWGLLSLSVCLAPYAIWAVLYRRQYREYREALRANDGKEWAALDQRFRRHEHLSIVGTWFTAFLFTLFLVAPCALVIGISFGLHDWTAAIPPSGILLLLPVAVVVGARRSRLGQCRVRDNR